MVFHFHMFWSLFTTDDRFDLPFQHVTMSGSISRNLSFGPWWPLAYPRTRVWQQKSYRSGKKTGWWHQLCRKKRDKLIEKKALRSQSSEGLNKHIWVCLKMSCTPLYPMVLLIIIPLLNGYFIGNINPTFSGPNPFDTF